MTKFDGVLASGVSSVLRSDSNMYNEKNDINIYIIFYNILYHISLCAY